MLDNESEYTRFTEQKHSPSSQHPSISQSSPFHHSEHEDDIHDTALSTRIMKHSPHGNGMNGHTHSSLGATALSATWGNNYGTVATSSPPHSTPDDTDLTPYRLRQEARTTRINVARDTSTHGIHEHEMNVMHDDVKHDGHEGGEHGVPLLLAYRHTSSSIRKDYTTVDWFFSKYQLSRMMSQLHRENTQNGWKGKMKNAFNAASGWIVLALVGVATAMSASAIHLLADWLTEIKVGYCSEHGAWVTHRVCCLETTGDCQYWTRWHMTVMPSMSSAGAYWYNYMCYIFWGVTFAGLASWLCYVYSHHAAGSGIAEIKCILGGFIIKRFLGVRTLVIKSLGLILAVASGMNLGKEGPLVHIACCWGNIFSRQFIKYSSNEVKKREVLSASAAAGVSAAFGAPLGGVLFSLEAVSSYFPPKTLWRSFWCAISAALVLQYLDPFQTGKLVQFAVSKVDPWNWFELLPFMLIGVLGGALGAIFIRGNLRLQQWRKNHRWIREHRIHEIIIIATITCIINYTNLYIRGSSTSLLAELFGNCDNLSITDDYDPNQSSDSVANALCAKDDVALHIVLLIIAGIVKFILMIATYGTFIPAGVFVPALSVGACFGRVIGWVMALWHDYAGDTFIFSVCAGKSTCVSPGIYAIVGAAATLGGITRMTVSIVVIMFEVTGSLESLVPIMIAVVCSKWVGDAYGGAGGLYGEIIEMNGFPFIDPNLEVETTGPACDIMAIEPVTVTTYGCTLKSLRELLQAHPYHGFPIIDNDRDRLVYGFISRADLQIQIDAITEEEEENDPLMRIHFSSDPPPFAAGEAKDFSVAVDKYPIRVLPDTPIDRILDLFKSLGLRYIIVTSNKGRLLGLIKKKDLLHYFHTQNIR